MRRPFALVVVTALVAAACSGGDSAQDGAPGETPRPVVIAETRTVIGNDGGVALVGEASLTVPAGSLAAGTIVLAQQLDDSEFVTSDVSVASTPGPVRFVTDGEVTGTLTVRIPIRDDANGARILSADEDSSLWFDERTEVVDGFAVAEVDHLSWFAAVSDQVSNLTYTLFGLAGARADPPECPAGPPDWIVDIVSSGQGYVDAGLLPNAPLLACGDRTSRDDEDALVLRVTANRGYSIVVRASDASMSRAATRSGALLDARADIENEFLTRFADDLTAAYRAVGMDDGGQLYTLPALRTSDLTLADPLEGRPGLRQETVETVSPMRPQALALALIVDLMSVSVGQLPPTPAEELARCLVSTSDSGALDEVAEILTFFESCTGSGTASRFLENAQRWFRRLKTPIQIGLLTSERAVDAFAGPDRIDVIVQRVRTGSDDDTDEGFGASVIAMHRNDAGRTGVGPPGAPAAAPRVLWERTAGGSDVFLPGAIAADGSVYLRTAGGSLVSLDARTGVERWRFTPNGGRLDLPAVVDSLVIVHAEDSGVVHAVDATTGNERWRTPLAPGLESVGGIVVSNGQAFVATAPDAPGTPSTLHVLEVDSGDLTLSVELDGWARLGGATIGQESVFIGTQYITALERATGKRRWSTIDDRGEFPNSGLVTLKDDITFANQPEGGFGLGYVSAREAASGTLLWIYADGLESQPAFFVEWLTSLTVDDDAAYVGGWVRDIDFTPGDGPYGTVRALDRSSGAARWSTSVPGAATAGPTLSGDVLLVGTTLISRATLDLEGGAVHALDRRSGVELWSFAVDGRPDAPVVWGDIVVVTDTSGKVTALR